MEGNRDPLAQMQPVQGPGQLRKVIDRRCDREVRIRNANWSARDAAARRRGRDRLAARMLATPMWQSPAIFLQHAISAAVICAFGRQARAGDPIQRRIRTSPMMWCNFDTV